jgi:hypothetical protein
MFGMQHAISRRLRGHRTHISKTCLHDLNRRTGAGGERLVVMSLYSDKEHIKLEMSENSGEIGTDLWTLILGSWRCR